MTNSMIAKTDAGPFTSFPAIFPGKAHKIALAASATSVVLSTDTTIVRLVTDNGALFDIGMSPATGNLHYLPGSTHAEYFACQPGSTILCTQSSGSANLYITEGAGSFGDLS